MSDNRLGAVEPAKVADVANRLEQSTSTLQLRRAQTFAVTTAPPHGETQAPPGIKRPASVALIKHRCTQPTLHIRLGQTERGRTEPLRYQGNAVTTLSSLVVQCATRGASIFVSLDGSDPALPAEKHGDSDGTREHTAAAVAVAGNEAAGDSADEAVCDAAARARRDTAPAVEAAAEEAGGRHEVEHGHGSGGVAAEMAGVAEEGREHASPGRISAQGVFIHTVPVPWPAELHGAGALPVADAAEAGSSGSCPGLAGKANGSLKLPSLSEAAEGAEAEAEAEAEGACEEASEDVQDRGVAAGARQGCAGAAAERAARCQGPRIEVRAAAACNGYRPSLVVVSQRFRVVDERPVLLALFEALGGESWSRQRHWGHDSDRPIDQWEGVVVDGGWVVALELEDNNISGSLPQCIGQLERLERLSLAYNKVTGAIPASIGQCSKLRQLLLHDNRLCGTVPQLHSCAELEQAFLHNNDIFDDIDQALAQCSSHPNGKALHFTF